VIVIEAESGASLKRGHRELGKNREAHSEGRGKRNSGCGPNVDWLQRGNCLEDRVAIGKEILMLLKPFNFAMLVLIARHPWVSH
jgi:hypothetical protein